MKKYATFILLVIVFLLLTWKGKAQGTACGTDYGHNLLMQNDAAYRQQIMDLQWQVDDVLRNQPANRAQAALYTIPVVVHVIHLGEPVGTGHNISDVQIHEAIDSMNARFRRITGSGTDVEMEFCLAARDPSGYATTGINRIDGSSVPNYAANGIEYLYSNCDAPSELTIKDLSKWPTSDYYNIWVVSEICQGFGPGWGGFAGFATYPTGGDYDGTVIRSYYMTGDNLTLTHELGHGFFLYHTFDGDLGGGTCPADNPCATEGDRICDTPPHKTNDCGTTNPCAVTGVWENSSLNYMSYCGLRERFTQGQKDMMRATATVSPRASLLTSQGCGASTGIENTPEQWQFSVLPNPSSGSFIVSLNTIASSGTISVCDMLGAHIFEEALTQQTQKINLKNVAPGIYLVRVNDGSKQFTRKLIVL